MPRVRFSPVGASKPHEAGSVLAGTLRKEDASETPLMLTTNQDLQYSTSAMTQSLAVLMFGVCETPLLCMRMPLVKIVVWSA